MRRGWIGQTAGLTRGCAGERVKLKIDGNGNAVLIDGMPVYVHDDGSEKPLDAAAMAGALKKANAEAKERRESLSSLQEKLKAFEDLDPEEARAALTKVRNIDAKKLIDAGEVDKVREAIAKSFGEKLTAAEKRAQDLEAQLHGELIGGGFARSKFVGEKLTLPPDLAQAAFGRHFAIENGRVVAKDASGVPILSRTTGQPADFDEALETLVSQYPHRESILRATQKGGSGAQPGTGGAAGKPVYTRKQFDAMDANQRREAALSGATFTD